jgi:hypothetical protein
MSGAPRNVCLQCGETREAVKANGYSCATLSGYETVEVDQEWERHHWRDWSDSELDRMGVSPHRRAENRRTLSWDMEFVVLQSICDQQEHVYSEDAGDPDSYHFGVPKDLCIRCYTRTGETGQ